jgi:hypothetical protein
MISGAQSRIAIRTAEPSDGSLRWPRFRARSGAALNGVEMRVTQAKRVSPTPHALTVGDPGGKLVDVAQHVHSPSGRGEYRDLTASPFGDR